MNKLFGPDEWARVVEEPSALRGFTAFTARMVIARCAAVPTRALDVAIGGVSFSNGPSGEFRTDSEGNGFAFWVSKADSGTRLALCQLRKDVSSKPVVRTVGPHEVLLLRLTIDGQDCVCVMHAMTPDLATTTESIRSGRLSKDRSAFNASLAALIRTPIRMRAGDPSPAVKLVLQRAE